MNPARHRGTRTHRRRPPPHTAALLTAQATLDAGFTDEAAGQLAHRTVQRCLPHAATPRTAVRHCEQAARSVLEACDQRTTPAQPRTPAES